MGAYLYKPVTDKEVENASDHNVVYSCSSMQGWRTSQEDAHNAILNFGDQLSLFAVYDGHGGAEVAKLCADYLPEHIKKHEDFINGKISESLVKSFIEFDKSILSKENQELLKKLANIEEASEVNSDADENHNLLQEEARMPLEQVLGKYMNDKDNSKEDESNQEVETKKSSSSKSLLSNFLRAAYGEKITLFGDKGDESEEEEDDDSEEYVAEDEKEDEEDDEDDEEEEDDENDEEDVEENDEEENGFMNTIDMLENTPGFNSGSTAVLSLIDFKNSKIYVANAGDSRCVLCRNGETVELSQDHKPEDKIESDRIEKAGGILTEDGRVNGGLNLSRSIGDHFYKKNTNLSLEEQMISALPDVKVMSYIPNEDEFMVLACDGIWNSMTSEEVVTFVKERINEMELEVIVAEIFNHCLAPNTSGDGTGCDNMTCIIVRFKKFSDQNNDTHCNGSNAAALSKSNNTSPTNQTQASVTKRKLTNDDSSNGDTKTENNKDSGCSIDSKPATKLRKLTTSTTTTTTTTTTTEIDQ